MSALSRFVWTTFGFAFVVVLMILIHVCFVSLRHLCKSKLARHHNFSPTLVGAVGTTFMAFFISVSSTIFAPFECLGHPNGKQTVRAYPEVVCWDSDDGHVHQDMVV